jgi:hypothetical protein
MNSESPQPNPGPVPAFEWVLVTRDPTGGVALSGNPGLHALGGMQLLLDGRDQALVAWVDQQRQASQQGATAPTYQPGPNSQVESVPTADRLPSLTEEEALRFARANPDLEMVYQNLLRAGAAGFANLMRDQVQ